MRKQVAFIILILSFSFCPRCFSAIDESLAKTYKAHAAEIITKALDDSDPAYRAKAIEVVSNAKMLDLMPKVEKLMGDNFVPVRFAAAAAVGDMEYYHSKGALEKLVEVGDPTSKLAAAYALSRLGQKKYADVIYQALSGTDQNLKANAAILVGKLGNRDDLPKLYQVLRDKTASDAAMLQAAEAIASMGDKDIYQRLWTLLISKHPDDRIMGIRAMGALKSPEAKEALLTMFYDEVLEVRLVTAAELGKIGDDSGWPEVVDALTKPLTQIDAEAMERAYSYRKKEDNGDAQSQSEASRLLFQPIYRTDEEYNQAVERSKMLAALAIGYIKSENLAQYLPQLLTDTSRDVRIAAAQSVLLAFK